MVLATLLGLLFGFVGSMPIAGPISALVFTRALRGRMQEGLFIAIGGALAEAIYAALAFWGFAALLEKYDWIQSVSNGVASLILAVLGVMFLFQSPSQREVSAHDAPDPSKTGIVLGFTITILNPTLIATWSAASAILFSTGLVALEGQQVLPFSFGVLVGIVLWFTALLRLVGHFRERFSYASLNVVLRVTGGGLLLLAAWFGWRLFA